MTCRVYKWERGRSCKIFFSKHFFQIPTWSVSNSHCLIAHGFLFLFRLILLGFFICGHTFCEVIGEFLLKTDSKVDFFYNSEAIMLQKYCFMWVKSNSEYNMKRRVVLWDGTNMLILNWELFLLFNLVLGEAEALTVLGLGQQALARGLHNLIISTGKLVKLSRGTWPPQPNQFNCQADKQALSLHNPINSTVNLQAGMWPP